MTNKQLPKVTIMIPTYNQESFIKKAIESALMQTYPNLEIIVSNDASTDRTQNIINKFRDPRLKIFHNKKNIGRTANYRKLLYQHASGDYVVNLDGDDYYTDPDFITEAIDIIRSDQNIVMAAARASWEGKKRKKSSKIPKEKEIDGLQVLERLPEKTYLIKHMATLYNRKIAIELDFYRFNTISSDWESLYRLASHGKIGYLNKIIGTWRKHSGNETKSVDIEKFIANLEIWPSIYKEAQKSGLSIQKAQRACNRCIGYFSNRYLAKLSNKGIKYQLIFLAQIVKKYRTASKYIFKPEYFKITAKSILQKKRANKTLHKKT